MNILYVLLYIHILMHISIYIYIYNNIHIYSVRVGIYRYKKKKSATLVFPTLEIWSRVFSALYSAGNSLDFFLCAALKIPVVISS